MKNVRASLTAILLVLLLPVLSWAWQGKVVGVADGDTITVLHDGKGEKIRLYGVDAPEKRQDFGQRAKQFTSDQVFGKTVEVTPMATDRYGRTVGLVTVDGQSLSRNLVASGLAWVYDQYCHRDECVQWRGLQEQAKASKSGLWSIPNPTPPWEFRHPKAIANQVPPPAVTLAKSDNVEMVYHGNQRSHVFHRPSCQHYNCPNCVVEFKSREEAIAAGYRPCKVCNP